MDKMYAQGQAAAYIVYPSYQKERIEAPQPGGLLDTIAAQLDQLISQVGTVNQELSVFRAQVLGSFDPSEVGQPNAKQEPPSAIERIAGLVDTLGSAINKVSRQAVDIRRLG